MRTRRKLFVLLAVLAVFGICVGILTHTSEPRYQGRPAHEWIESLSGYQDSVGQSIARQEAERALKHFGTNVIPLILKWFVYEPKPSKMKQSLAVRLYRFQLLMRWEGLQRWLYAKDAQEIRREAAIEAFAVLGPAAASATPELAKLATVSTNKVLADQAVDALVRIGSPGLPSLLGIITNANAASRFYATQRIRQLGTNALPAIPILVLCLKDPALAPAAFETLGDLKLAPQAVVPAIIDIAADPGAKLRSVAILTLGDFGQDARQAVPMLLAALTDSDAVVRNTATNALQHIAPHAVNNAPSH